MVRFSMSDVRIQAKSAAEEEWKEVKLTSNLPKPDRDITQKGLTKTRIQAEIVDFPPAKEDLPSRDAAEMNVETNKRKDRMYKEKLQRVSTQS